MTPLQEATTDELLDELRQRYSAMVFVGERQATTEDDGAAGGERQDARYVVWAGGLATCMGLADILGIRLGQALHDGTVINDDEEAGDGQ